MRDSKPPARLRAAEIADGIKKCIQSAHDLYHSGVVAHYQDISSTARALLILAVEEYGKIGLLYWALTIPMGPPHADAQWNRFWKGFHSHELKNEVGRLMMVHGDGLLPGLAHFFGHRFPFLAVRPRDLELQKQTMLYVNFHRESGRFVSPRDVFGSGTWDNRPLIEEVESLVRYVARNNQQHVFDPRVLKAYRELHTLAVDRSDWAALLRLFFGCVLGAPTGMATEVPLEEVVVELKKRHPEGIDGLVKRWTSLGDDLRGKKG